MSPYQRRVRVILGTDPSVLDGLIWSVAALVSATGFNLLIHRWVTGVPPFLTYFPVVALAALLLGWRWGAAVLITAAVVCDYAYLAPFFAWSVSNSDFVSILLFVIGGVIIILTAAMLRGSSRRVEALAARERALNGELQHRVGNTLAIVQALASQTARNSATIAAFNEAFGQRLQALKDANDVLSATEWVSCDLPDLAMRGLKAFLPNDAVRIAGPPCVLQAASAVPLTLALHELATNATKHGALSTPEGRVSLSWTLEAGQLSLLWLETLGPPVIPPTRRGLGSRLLRPQRGLDDVVVDYAPGGFRCTITINEARPA